MSGKISVAMAVYKGEKYLPVQLDSILAQLGPDDEVIASYDPSSDGTLALLQDYAARDPRVKVLMNPRPGVTGNFNNAILHSSGDYIYISDQDDQWAPNKVEAVQRAFAETGCGLVIHNGVHTGPDLAPSGGDFFHIYRIGNGKLHNIAKPRMSGCCMAFTREMRDIILPIPEIHGYDQWIALVCEFWGKIAYPEEVLLYHRLHGGNATTGRRPLSVILPMRAKLLACLALRGLRQLGRRLSGGRGASRG